MSVTNVLNVTLVEVAGKRVTVATALTALVVTIATISALLHYLTLASGFGLALDTLGVDLSARFAAGALFAVGLGFAMQSIAQNFVAGVILLTERSIKPGDIRQVEGKTVKVVQMGMRSSVGRTRDGEDLVMPNSVLVQITVTNYTLRDQAFRIRVQAGISYASDMRLVRRRLESVAERVNTKWAVPDTCPHVIMTAFGSRSAGWEVAIWMNHPREFRPALSDLHEEIWWAFQDAGVVIAFPQVDVHLDAPAAAALSLVTPAAG
jgi:potassium-dependent mechanosensitive channel